MIMLAMLCSPCGLTLFYPYFIVCSILSLVEFVSSKGAGGVMHGRAAFKVE